MQRKIHVHGADGALYFTAEIDGTSDDDMMPLTLELRELIEHDERDMQGPYTLTIEHPSDQVRYECQTDKGGCGHTWDAVYVPDVFLPCPMCKRFTGAVV